jgi:hypothetical protein
VSTITEEEKAIAFKTKSYYVFLRNELGLTERLSVRLAQSYHAMMWAQSTLSANNQEILRMLDEVENG